MRTIIALFLCVFLLASCASSRVAFKKDYNFAKINSIKIGQFSPASGYPNSSSVVANEFIRQLLAMGYTVKTDPSDKADVELFGSVTQFNPNRKYLMQASNTTDTAGQNIIINNTQPIEINGSQVYTLGSSLGPDANLSIIATNANCGIAAYLKDSSTGDVVWSTTYSYESLDLAAAAENTVRYILSDLPPEKEKLNKKNIISKIASSLDSTLLRATATKQELTQLCSDAQKYGFASVCVNPCNVLFCKKLLSSVKLCAVIGFPLGANTTKIKAAEAKDAIKNGACEFDVVINIGAAIDGNFDFVREELNQISSVLNGATLKVIIETCYFNKEQLTILGKIALECGASFLKTSTGFGPCGATVEVVKLLSQITDGKAGVKASGGIKTLKDVLDFLDAGATRIGTSNAVKIINEIRG